jgi:hypothetical protein
VTVLTHQPETSPAAVSLDQSFRDYAWGYFALHSEQRMKTFHFYILLATALVGTVGLLIKTGELHQWMAAFGFLLVFFSFVFWKFDQRTRHLIKHAEAALAFLDQQHELADQNGLPHPLKLFAHEAAVTSRLELFPLANAHFSYARCLRWIFSMFALIGLSFSFICIAFFSA